MSTLRNEAEEDLRRDEELLWKETLERSNRQKKPEVHIAVVLFFAIIVVFVTVFGSIALSSVVEKNFDAGMGMLAGLLHFAGVPALSLYLLTQCKITS